MKWNICVFSTGYEFSLSNNRLTTHVDLHVMFRLEDCR